MPTAVPPASLPTARVAGRLSIAFLLEFIEIGRGDRALIDTLILVGVVQANIALVTREADLQRTFAAYDDAPPDEVRRAVSVSAVAGSLGLPYETVRRRIVHLAGAGLVVSTPRGVYVPQEQLSSPEHMAASYAAFELLRDFYWRLKDIGALRPMSAEPPERPPAELIRAILRVFADYFLRTVDAVTRHVGDLIGGMVLLGVLTANTEHLPDDEGGLETAGAGGFVADRLRRPVSIAALAARLRLPEETVRRHAKRLVEDERCVRLPEGLLIPGEILARPSWSGLMAENLGHLNRMFSALGHLGVLAGWDAARAAAQPQAADPA